MVGRWDAADHSQLLSAAYTKARNSPVAVADGLLALFGVDRPTARQEVGALALAEMIVRVSAFLRKE